ncbi:endonuclease domain-containing protein [Psychrilyobacter atlanticus]|uniref:endonuclease domain-containing protein n=1 Tax=Psychrilyobacter atlanticus TaxID=271091 RepID=UPI0003FC7F8B|nr:endonuclease domain-containing protein [Psychrilyobacter atlanticus]
MGKEIFDKPSTLEKRRELKKNQTESEVIMWDRLRAKRFKGIKFKRQYGISEYIVDFYSSELMLAVEIDGNQHYKEDGLEYDEIRTEYLNNIGVKVIRFKNKEILNNIEKVKRGNRMTLFLLVFSSS